MAGRHDKDGMSTLFAVGVRWFVSEVATVLRLARDCYVFSFSVTFCVNKLVLLPAERVALTVYRQSVVILTVYRQSGVALTVYRQSVVQRHCAVRKTVVIGLPVIRFFLAVSYRNDGNRFTYSMNCRINCQG